MYIKGVRRSTVVLMWSSSGTWGSRTPWYLLCVSSTGSSNIPTHKIAGSHWIVTFQPSHGIRLPVDWVKVIDANAGTELLQHVSISVELTDAFVASSAMEIAEWSPADVTVVVGVVSNLAIVCRRSRVGLLSPYQRIEQRVSFFWGGYSTLTAKPNMFVTVPVHKFRCSWVKRVNAFCWIKSRLQC